MALICWRLGITGITYFKACIIKALVQYLCRITHVVLNPLTVPVFLSVMLSDFRKLLISSYISKYLTIITLQVQNDLRKLKIVSTYSFVLYPWRFPKSTSAQPYKWWSWLNCWSPGGGDWCQWWPRSKWEIGIPLEDRWDKIQLRKRRESISRFGKSKKRAPRQSEFVPNWFHLVGCWMILHWGCRFLKLRLVSIIRAQITFFLLIQKITFIIIFRRVIDDCFNSAPNLIVQPNQDKVWNQLNDDQFESKEVEVQIPPIQPQSRWNHLRTQNVRSVDFHRKVFHFHFKEFRNVVADCKSNSAGH